MATTKLHNPRNYLPDEGKEMYDFVVDCLKSCGDKVEDKKGNLVSDTYVVCLYLTYNDVHFALREYLNIKYGKNVFKDLVKVVRGDDTQKGINYLKKVYGDKSLKDFVALFNNFDILKKGRNHIFNIEIRKNELPKIVSSKRSY